MGENRGNMSFHDEEKLVFFPVFLCLKNFFIFITTKKPRLRGAFKLSVNLFGVDHFGSGDIAFLIQEI